MPGKVMSLPVKVASAVVEFSLPLADTPKALKRLAHWRETRKMPNIRAYSRASRGKAHHERCKRSRLLRRGDGRAADRRPAVLRADPRTRPDTARTRPRPDCQGVGEVALTRPLIGRLLLESGQMEALLDEYGARQNQHWSRFRALMAALKNFARIGEVLAYIQRRLPAYRLLPVEADFHAATRERLQQVGGVVADVATDLLEEAQRVGVDRSPTSPGSLRISANACRLAAWPTTAATGSPATPPLPSPIWQPSFSTWPPKAICCASRRGFRRRTMPPASRIRSARSACASSPSASTTCNPCTTPMSPAPRSKPPTPTCPSCAATPASSIICWRSLPTSPTTTSAT
jgi:hypothetical protein